MRERVGAVIIKDGAILLVTGFDESNYWTPGGGKDGQESDEETLRRELREELGVEVTSTEPYCDFEALGGETGRYAHYRYYRVEIAGTLKPAEEVTGYAWQTRDKIVSGEVSTFPDFHSQLAPRLVADNLI